MRLSRLRSLVLLTRPSISLYYHALLLEVGRYLSSNMARRNIQEQIGSLGQGCVARRLLLVGAGSWFELSLLLVGAGHGAG